MTRPGLRLAWLAGRHTFSLGDSGVSPVVAVILMVAITVVLAATVFVMASDIGRQSSNTAPTISFKIEENLDRLVVVTAGPKADWARLGLRIQSQGTTSPPIPTIYLGTDAAGGYQNEGALATGLALSSSSSPAVTTTSDPIGGGEYLEFCGSAAETFVKVLIIDLPASFTVAGLQFVNVNVC